MKKVKLKDVGRIITGKTPSTKNPAFFDNDFMFITPEDITNNPSNLVESKRYISKFGLSSIASNSIDGESVVVGCIGSDMGNIGYVKGKCATNQQINSITELKKEFDAKFIYYCLKPKKEYFKKIAGSTTTPILPKSVFEEIEIIVPLQPTQTAIAKVLSSLDDKIELNNKINKELENLAKTIYEYWFVQFDFPNEKGKPYKSSGGKMIYNETLKNNIPKGWEVNKLECLTSFKRGISYKSVEINGENGMPMINLGSIDITRNYRTGQLKYYSGKYNKEDIVKKGDMLIACTDLTRNCDIIGSPIIVPEEFDEYLFSMDLAKINIFNETSDMFIYESLRTDTYHNYIKYFASGTNVLHLNLNGISWYEIAIPPEKIQKQFSEILQPLKKIQSLIINDNRNLMELRDFLLPLLMNGQVTVKDIENKKDIISFKNQENNDQRFKMWLQNKRLAARGETDLQTLREIFDAMDEDDK